MSEAPKQENTSRSIAEEALVDGEDGRSRGFSISSLTPVTKVLLNKPTRKTEQIVQKRAYKHINDFIRVQILFKDGSRCQIIVDVNNKIEYLARQIEAEASLQGIVIQNQTDNKTLLKSVDVYQLYDAGNLPLVFSAKIKDVLNFDDDIYPITSFEDDEDEQEEEGNGSESYKMVGSSFSISEDLNSKKTILSKVEDRLKSVLNNTVSLQFFNEFCLQEYAVENVLFWVEAQVYASIIEPELQKTFSKHLYYTYIKNDAPLVLNVDEELRKSITKEYSSPNASTYIDIQAFIYILIKQHAYNRYENSLIFKRFLKFKEEDRYSYVQGKTSWNFESTFVLQQLHEIQKYSDIAENPESAESQVELNNFGGEVNSALFRQHILLHTISRYFPKTAVTKGYFDIENRAQWGTRHRQMQKQKKLQKFFGDRPTVDLMDIQGHLEATDDFEEGFTGGKVGSSIVVTEGSLGSEISLSLEIDKRRKAEKLSGFFGGNLPNRHMKKQNLLNESHNSNEVGSVYSFETPGLVQDEELEFLGTVNTLDADEKMMLLKRAKKLIGVLGADFDLNVVSKTQVVLNNKAYNNKEDADSRSSPPGSPSGGEYPSHTSTSTVTISSDDVQTSRVAQKQRLDKIAYVMGERISEDAIQKIAEEIPIVAQARPLTFQEKKLFLKKNTKLEGFFGNTVPAHNVITYKGEDDFDDDSLNTSSNTSMPMSPLDVTSEETERQTQVSRLKKLRKMLGIHERDGPVISEDDLKKIEDSILRNVPDDSDRVSLLEDLDNMKKRSGKRMESMSNASKPISPLFTRSFRNTAQ